MLKGLFKPAWQHPDPDARCRAVAAIEPEQREVLAEIARGDAEPAVRVAALRRSDDLALLAERAGTDPDAAVCVQATERYRALLAGQAEGAATLAERIEHLGSDTPTGLLEFLAREGKEPELRVQALAGVHSASLLGELTIGDPVAAVRHAALERLSDEPTLEQIQHADRQNDKHVRRRVREKLAALRAARERPLAVTSRCQAICTLVDQLAEDDVPARAEERMRQLEREWQALEPEHRQPLESAFATARQRFEQHLEERHQRIGKARFARETVIAGLQAALDENTEGSVHAGRALEEALRDARSAWADAPALPPDGGEDLQRHFDALCQSGRDAADEARREATLATLCADGETLLARSGPLGEHEVKEWERRLPAPLPATPGQRNESREERTAAMHQALRDRVREQASHKDEMLARLATTLEELATAVREGTAKRALPLDKEIGTLLAELATIGVSRERIGPLAARHRSLAPKVRVMESWQRFGADQARERLCAKVEALLDGEHEPPEIATLLRTARGEWQGLPAGDPAREHALRRRFEKAASKAFKPCKAFFEEQTRSREASRQKKLELLARLDAFVADSDWSHVDWKAALRLRRDTLADWQRAGPADRNKARGLERKLRSSLAALDEPLQHERQRCLQQREGLIERATALQEAPDPRRAVDECKQLQREWQVTVPGPRRAEDALWARFRAACDNVFGARQRAFDGQRETWQANLARKRTLCEQAEALANTEDVADAQRELARLQSEWREAGPVARAEAAAVEKRFAAAAARLVKRREADAEQARRASLRRLQDKAELCHAAEALAGTADQGLAALETRWASLAPLDAKGEEQIIAARFDQACRAARGEDEALTSRARTESENRQARETLCLRMEILAGVESPPEYAAARMNFQVQRLSSALGGRGAAPGRDTLEGLLREWCLNGAAPAADAATLESRFSTAAAAGAARQG